MKFLILNTDYSDFLDWLYVQHPGLENQSYEEQMRVRVESLFGVADFYSSNLRKLSYEAYDIHANNEFMQKAWAKEHGIPIQELEPAYQDFYTFLQRGRNVAAQSPLRYLKPIFRPFLKHLDNQPKWFYKILAEQIKIYKPDILLNHEMVEIINQFFKTSEALGEDVVIAQFI